MFGTPSYPHFRSFFTEPKNKIHQWMHNTFNGEIEMMNLVFFKSSAIGTPDIEK
jgi:hypothetical protein